MQSKIATHSDLYQTLRKPTAIFGLLFFIILIAIQFYFFELRLLVDGSVSLFLIAVTKTFDVAEDRFMIGFNQVLPVIGANMGVSLKSLAISYLANDVLIYLIAFLLLLLPLKDPLSALILLVGYVATAKYHFFIMTYSAAISWPFMLLLFSVLRHYNWRISKWGVLPLVVSLFYLVFAHPVVTIVFSTIWAYQFMQFNTNKERTKWLIPMGIVTVLFIMKWIDPDPYDVQQLQDVPGISWNRSQWHLARMQKWVPMFYPTLMVAVAFMAYQIKSWLQNKQYGQILVPLGGLGLLLVFYIMFGIPFKYPLGHWANKAFAPTTLLFLYIIADRMRTQNIKLNGKRVNMLIMICALLTVWELSVIVFKVSDTFEQRLVAIHELIDQVPTNERSKFIILDKDIPENSFFELITASEVAVISELFYDFSYTPNIIVNTETKEPALDTLGTDLIYVNTNASIPAGAYEPYFNFKSGEFHEIPFDGAIENL